MFADTTNYSNHLFLQFKYVFTLLIPTPQKILLYLTCDCIMNSFNQKGLIISFNGELRQADKD